MKSLKQMSEINNLVIEMRYTYEYPRPMVTVDILPLRISDGNLQLLLIRRGNEPFQNKWALPGGFMEMEEKLIESARRELMEETGLKNISLFPLIYADDPERDPRGRILTIIYGSILSPPFEEVEAGDDAALAHWHSLANLPQMAFDHRIVIDRALEKLKHICLWKLWVLLFLPKLFNKQEFEIACRILFPRLNPKTILTAATNSGLVKKSGDKKYFREINDNDLISRKFEDHLKIWNLLKQ